MPRNSDALEIGYKLDEYVIVDVLGSGGFGITYHAIAVDEDTDTEEIVPRKKTTTLMIAVLLMYTQDVTAQATEVGGGLWHFTPTPLITSAFSNSATTASH